MKWPLGSFEDLQLKNVARNGLSIAAATTVGLVVIAMLIAIWLALRPPDRSQLAALKFDLEMFKGILAGFVVGMIGILIPAVFNEAQATFKQRIDSRVAYSSAKTGLDYLKLKLSTCDLAGAVIALRQVHFNKHQAELFDELDEWLGKKFSPAITRDEWGSSMFEYLNGTKCVLEANAGSWDALSPAQRIQLLDPVLPANLYPNQRLPHPS